MERRDNSIQVALGALLILTVPGETRERLPDRQPSLRGLEECHVCHEGEPLFG